MSASKDHARSLAVSMAATVAYLTERVAIATRMQVHCATRPEKDRWAAEVAHLTALLSAAQDSRQAADKVYAETP